MEPCVNYDQYDAYIHGYNYHTGFPEKDTPMDNDDDNLLNSYEFMRQFDRQEFKNA